MAGTPVKIFVPGNHLMAGLLGQRDELLRMIEHAFPDVRIAVRGNEVSIEAADGGSVGSVDRVATLFQELIILLEALHLYPIFYLNLTAALANIDPALDEAARNLGASRWRRWRRITLPLILPGLFAGATIVFDTTTATRLAWGIQSVPTVVYLDSAGNVVYNGKAVWKDLAAAIENTLKLPANTIQFKAAGTGYG